MLRAFCLWILLCKDLLKKCWFLTFFLAHTERLDLSSNALSGTLPQSLFDNPTIRKYDSFCVAALFVLALVIVSMKSSHLVRVFSLLYSIVSISLPNNQIGGPIPSSTTGLVAARKYPQGVPVPIDHKYANYSKKFTRVFFSCS